MREIKFRSWDKSVKKMSNPYNIQRQPTFNTEYKGEFCISTIKPSHWLGCNSLSENKRQIAMQYTGLKDKNGVEIYEGDIMRLSNITSKLSYLTVKYIDNAFILDGELATHKESAYFIEREVIGNIYENPELLNGEKQDES